MPSLLFPDPAERYCVDRNGRPARNKTARLYLDRAMTTAATVFVDANGSPGAAIAGGVLTTDAYGFLPEDFWGPTDGRDTLYISVNGGPATPIHAKSDTRLDLLTSRVDDLEAGGGTGSGTDLVHKSGNETITGVKTFAVSPVVPDPSDQAHAIPRAYADNAIIAEADVRSAADTALDTRVGDLESQPAPPPYEYVDNADDGVAAFAASALATHAADTTGVHGIADTSALVLTDDARLSDARTPTAHAASHASAGSDPVTVAQTQVTGLSGALAAKADLVGGVVPSAQIPAIAITTFLGTVANQAAMLALSGQSGDWAIRSDTGTTWVITGADPTQLADWTQMPSAGAPVVSVNGETGAVTLSASEVGALAADSNLSDVASASTARTNLGLGTAAVTNTGTGASNTILGNDARLTDARTPTSHAASHGSGGGDPVTVAQSQVTGLATALSGKQDTDTDLTAIAALDSAQSGVVASDGAGWLRKSYAALKTALGLVKADVGLGNVSDLAPADLPVSTAQQTALDAKVPTARTLTTTAPLTGGGDLSANRTLAVSGATTSTTGVVQLAGDFAGTATAPTIATGAVTSAKIADGTIVDGDINASAAIAQSKISGLTTDLGNKQRNQGIYVATDPQWGYTSGTDISAACQAAINAMPTGGSGGGVLYIPPGDWTFSAPVVLKTGVTVRGAGRIVSRITCTAGMFIWTATLSNVYVENLYLRSNGGHIFTNSGGDFGIYTTTVRGCYIFAFHASASIMHHDSGFDYDNVVFEDCYLVRGSTSTVPAFNIVNSAGAANENRWKQCWVDGQNATAAPFILIENTSNQNYAYDNRLVDLTGERNPGGLLWARSNVNLIVDNVIDFDAVGNYVTDFIRVDKSPTGLASKHCVVRNSGRRGGTLNAGIYDVNFVPGEVKDSTIETANHSTSGLRINFDPNDRITVLNVIPGSWTGQPSGVNALFGAQPQFVKGLYIGTVQETSGTGSPNGVVVGSPGDVYHRIDGGAGTVLYVKETGTATTTGWVGYGVGSGSGGVTSVNGDTGPAVTITKSTVGLFNVDNTADTAKPVSTAQQTALNLKANLASPTFTGTVGGITKSMVGLGNVDNTADTAKPVSTAQAAAIAAVAATVKVADVQIFTATGTWTKPAGAKTVRGLIIPPGGGGGAGRKGAAATVRAGGGGGAPGVEVRFEIDAALLPSTVTVTVGAAGVGGAAQTTDSTNGANGTAGGHSTFEFFRGHGGPGGGGGTAAGGAAGGATSGSIATGGAGSSAGAVGSGASNTLSATGGGGGGGISAANVANGGGGFNFYPSINVNHASLTGNSNGGTVDTTPPAATGMSWPSGTPVVGMGGGGGAASITTNAQNGGAGGNYGAGGGGGGGATDGVGNSGAGGNGAPGITVIITYF